MGSTEYIAIAGVLATVLGSLVTWLVMKRHFSSKRLTYSFEIEPLLKSADPDLARELKISFRGEELPQPALLSIEVSNTGHTAIEKANVIVQLPGATYLIPGYFVDIPAGYEGLWGIDRTDAEECTIRFDHINPGQIAKIRLLMDEVPSGPPRISCPMPNVRCVRGRVVTVGAVAEAVVQVVAPDPAKGSVPGVPHPHLVVQDDVFNRSRISTVIVCALTSNLNRASEPGNVLLEPGEGNLRKQSVVISSQISSIEKSQLGERIGSLRGTRVDEVIAALRFLQVSYFHDG